VARSRARPERYEVERARATITTRPGPSDGLASTRCNVDEWYYYS
jgi:hypothetical protein